MDYKKYRNKETGEIVGVSFYYDLMEVKYPNYIFTTPDRKDIEKFLQTFEEVNND